MCRGRYTLPVSCCCACACAGTAALSTPTPHSRRQNGVQISTRLLSRNRAESPIGHFSDRVFVCISKSSLASQCRPVSNYNGETILLQAWFSHGALFHKRKILPGGQGAGIRGYSDLADKNTRNSGPPGIRENTQRIHEEYAITGGMAWCGDRRVK